MTYGDTTKSLTYNLAKCPICDPNYPICDIYLLFHTFTHKVLDIRKLAPIVHLNGDGEPAVTPQIPQGNIPLN